MGKLTNATKMILTLISFLTLLLQNQIVRDTAISAIAAHPHLAAILAGVAAVLTTLNTPKKAA